jgi:hypothetical protein
MLLSRVPDVVPARVDSRRLDEWKMKKEIGNEKRS